METWVTVTEWMQLPGSIEKRPQRLEQDRALLAQKGADNRVWIAKIHWKNPNQSFPSVQVRRQIKDNQ